MIEPLSLLVEGLTGVVLLTILMRI